LRWKAFTSSRSLVNDTVNVGGPGTIIAVEDDCWRVFSRVVMLELVLE
jgi:hypothetical protein